jgi:hypothetical protein
LLFVLLALGHAQDGPPQCYGWSTTTETTDLTKLLDAKVWLLEKVPMDGRGDHYYRQIVGNGKIIELNVGRKEVHVETDCCVQYLKEGQSVCGRMPPTSDSPTMFPTSIPSSVPTALPTGSPKQFFVEMNPASSDAYNQEITWRIEHLATGISHGPYNFSTVALPVQLLQGPQVLHMYDNYGDGWNDAQWMLKLRGNGDATDVALAGPFTLLAEEQGYATRTFTVWDVPSTAPTSSPTTYAELIGVPTDEPTVPPTAPPTGDANGCDTAVHCNNETAWALGVCRDCDRYFRSESDSGCKDRFWKAWPIGEEEEYENRNRKESLDLALDIEDLIIRDPNHLDEAGFFSTAWHGQRRLDRTLLREPESRSTLALRSATRASSPSATSASGQMASQSIDQSMPQPFAGVGEEQRKLGGGGGGEEKAGVERVERVEIRDAEGNFVGYEHEHNGRTYDGTTVARQLVGGAAAGRRRLHLPIKDANGDVIAYTSPHRDSMSCGSDQPHCISYAYNKYTSGMFFGAQFGAGSIGGCSALDCEQTKTFFEQSAAHDCATVPKPSGVSIECVDDTEIFKDWKCYTCGHKNCNDWLVTEVDSASTPAVAAASSMVLLAAAAAVLAF